LEDFVKSLALAAALLFCASFPAAAQAPAPGSQPQGPVVVTSGEGIVKRTPDRVWVSISAESRAKSPRDAQRANADAMSAVLARLKGTGLPADAIRTTAYDLQPEFDYNDGRQTLRGYVARNSVEVRIDDIAKVGEILDVAVGSGATSVSGVRFDLKGREEAEREALKLAVADARRRAEAAAAGAGMTISGVVRIEEQRASMPQPRPMMMAMEKSMAMDAGQPPVAPGEMEIRASVTLTASIK
jgi:hypothetical protein